MRRIDYQALIKGMKSCALRRSLRATLWHWLHGSGHVEGGGPAPDQEENPRASHVKKDEAAVEHFKKLRWGEGLT